MADHNALRDKLSATNRYRRLIDLRREVQGSRGTMPFSIYAELENRIDEKIRTFDFPTCDRTKITVMFSNGLAMELNPEECVSAMRNDMRLSSYIFSKYPSAVDFNLDADLLVGMRTRPIHPREEEPEKLTPSDLRTPSDDVRIKVDLLVTKIDRLEKMYSETIPRLSRGIDDLKAKMDYLYKKLVEDQD